MYFNPVYAPFFALTADIIFCVIFISDSRDMSIIRPPSISVQVHPKIQKNDISCVVSPLFFRSCNDSHKPRESIKNSKFKRQISVPPHHLTYVIQKADTAITNSDIIGAKRQYNSLLEKTGNEHYTFKDFEYIFQSEQVFSTRWKQGVLTRL